MSREHDPHRLGMAGEDEASIFLETEGFAIIRRNFRFHRNEIDIIAEHNGTICFVEVKTRFSSAAGHPAEAVTISKQREIIKAASAYLSLHNQSERSCRFDVIAIQVHSMQGNRIGDFTLEHYTDAFQAGF